MNPDNGRAMAIPEDPEMITAAEQAAREVDSERREVSEFVEQLRRRQAYFFEKAQMHREAADHYTRMSEDLAELLNNPYVDGKKVEDTPGRRRSSASYEH
jgi:hypothetical protein